MTNNTSPRGVGEGDVECSLPVLCCRLLRPPDQRPQVLGQHPSVSDDLQMIHSNSVANEVEFNRINSKLKET